MEALNETAVAKIGSIEYLVYWSLIGLNSEIGVLREELAEANRSLQVAQRVKLVEVPILATQEDLGAIGYPQTPTGTRKRAMGRKSTVARGKKQAVTGVRKAKPATAPTPVTAGKRKMSAAGRKKIADAQKRRWAEKRAEKGKAPIADAPQVPDTEVSQAAS